jgi:signal transduction histidine kinase
MLRRGARRPGVEGPDVPAAERQEPDGDARKPASAPSHLPLPRTFQGRLSVAFLLVFAVAVGIVSIVTVFVVDNSLREQERANLAARATAVAAVVRVRAEATAEQYLDKYVVSTLDELHPIVRAVFVSPSTLTGYANEVALADVQLRFGLLSYDSQVFYPAKGLSTFSASYTAEPGQGQARDPISYTETFRFVDSAGVMPTWYLEVTLSDPYTNRLSSLAAVVGVLLLTSLGAIVLGIVAASWLARRFAAPLRRLTVASQALARGDLSHPVPVDRSRTGTAEIAALTHQFNAMAAQVQETMDVIRRDRDLSRDFLADVSHELRTPLAALRTFNELLQQKAGSDPAARAEFLESSAQQIERLDWLAMNLLELSKLDSGLVMLDLRPNDLRTTVTSAVEQAAAAAQRRGVSLALDVPGRALVVKHDPQRLGQAVSNLVANALKFTPRGGSVRVVMGAYKQGARIQVIDTGVGIDAGELPRIFERFYRGSAANEARGSGSGLGLAIVRSFVEMHGGRVIVESRLGAGSTFTIILPPDAKPGGLPAKDGGTATGPALPAPDQASADRSASPHRPGGPS